MTDVQLLAMNPGHFHAALVQKEMYPLVARRAHVYAPLGPDLLAHLQRIAGFNSRGDRPTSWELEIHASDDFRQRLLAERPGNVVVLAGYNNTKIDAIHDALNAGLHVLADKPWILRPDQFPRLQAVLELAEQRDLVAYDIMTERFEITSQLQKELVGAPEVLGELVPGSEQDPGVFMESVHYLCKKVAGAQLLRPGWFFDIEQQGEGLTDVGPHLVDLVNWMLFPGVGLDWQQDVQLVAGRRWPTVLSRADFQKVTGLGDFPAFLQPQLQEGRLPYYCNNLVSYQLRGIHVTLNAMWDYQAAPGAGDTHLAVVQGTRSQVEVRQGQAENYRPEVYVQPRSPADKAKVAAALQHQLAAWQTTYPGVAFLDEGQHFRLSIPEHYRVGHEAHFGQVTSQFLRYLQHQDTVPSWEKPNMLVKYHLTTQGVARARTAVGGRPTVIG